MIYGDHGVPARDGSAEPQGDLTTMLAAMDARLQLLQQELESVALPIAREGVGPAAAPGPASADEQAGPAQPPAGPRERARRRVTAVARSRSAPAGERAAGGSQVAAADPLAARAALPDAVVRQTIFEAEQQAGRVVEDARRRIAEIGARTRALLERAPAPPPEPAPAARPPASSRGRRGRAADEPERREYQGAVTVEAGPFHDVAQLNVFEDALGTVPGVEDVYIRTFERRHAHFELNVAAPTRLVAELRARAAGPLHVVEASEHDVRLQIGEDDLRPGSSR